MGLINDFVAGGATAAKEVYFQQWRDKVNREMSEAEHQRSLTLADYADDKATAREAKRQEFELMRDGTKAKMNARAGRAERASERREKQLDREKDVKVANIKASGKEGSEAKSSSDYLKDLRKAKLDVNKSLAEAQAAGDEAGVQAYTAQLSYVQSEIDSVSPGKKKAPKSKAKVHSAQAFFEKQLGSEDLASADTESLEELVEDARILISEGRLTEEGFKKAEAELAKRKNANTSYAGKVKGTSLIEKAKASQGGRGFPESWGVPSNLPQREKKARPPLGEGEFDIPDRWR